VLPSLELAAAASGSPLLQNAVGEANLRVAGGERIADALAGSGFFAYHFCWLLGMGEDRGEAELALESAAETMEGELLSRDRVLGSTLAPVIIIIVGLLIASLVVSLYLPIFTLGDAISM
jgi:type IV pilus assembly protein PilC